MSTLLVFVEPQHLCLTMRMVELKLHRDTSCGLASFARAETSDRSGQSGGPAGNLGAIVAFRPIIPNFDSWGHMKKFSKISFPAWQQT